MAPLRFLVLATGSKGNCAYVETAHARVLIDCGISPRRIFGIMRERGLEPELLDALFISHTHSDHISGLETLCRKLPLRVYCAGQHALALRQLAPQADVVPFTPGEGFHHRDIEVLPVPVCHDCLPTVMFKLYAEGRRLGVLTDLGCTTDELTALYGDCDVLLLESNHCEKMLLAGSYPEVLKRRIRSNSGHLSNIQAQRFASGLARLPRLLLGHLSDENNTPRAVSETFGGGLLEQIPCTVIPQSTTWTRRELSQ